MTPEQFCYWMQGFVELGGQPPNKEQWDSIRVHLATVFRKVTPPVDWGKFTPVNQIKPPSPIC